MTVVKGADSIGARAASERWVQVAPPFLWSLGSPPGAASPWTTRIILGGLPPPQTSQWEFWVRHPPQPGGFGWSLESWKFQKGSICHCFSAKLGSAKPLQIDGVRLTPVAPKVSPVDKLIRTGILTYSLNGKTSAK